MEKAETLGTIIKSFARDQLEEDDLPIFYYDKTIATRTGKRNSPMDALFRYCTVPLTKNAHLLLGHSSCGKSTELYRLKQRLEEAGHPVWMVNANLDMDLFQANCWDVMLNITEGLFKIADGYSIEIPEKTREAVLDYLKSDKEKIEEKERCASEWLSYIIEIADCISNSGNKKQPVLIFENMDKIQPPDKAFDIFCYSVLAQMPFPIIYTFPISLFYDSRFAAIMDLYEHQLLPMIKVSNIDMSENADGVNAVREIVKLRAELKLFDSDALNLLISKTGGVLRHLFRCIIESDEGAISRGSEKIETEDARDALSGLRSDLTRSLSQSDYPMLANIYSDRKYKEQIEDTEFLLKQMQSLVVLEYNGDRWHELHPLIAEFLIGQGVVDGQAGQ